LNLKTAKKLRRQSEQLALHTVLAAEENGLVLRHGKRTARKIYRDLKKGKLL
jgi:hypothetical protein